MVPVALGGLSASLWAEKLATKPHEHGSMKSLKGHLHMLIAVGPLALRKKGKGNIPGAYCVSK